jgi:hypothetical protein
MLRPLIAFSLAVSLARPGASTQELRAFHTPSGNIGCIADRDGGRWELRCDIGQHDWASPRQPRDCDLDYGDAIGLSAAGRAYFVCHGDTVLGQGRALPYGATWNAGPFACTSRQTGLTCTNAGGHGLFLGRATYRTF